MQVNTGSKKVVCNVWTDEARAAALEARRASTSADVASGRARSGNRVGLHGQAIQLHQKALAAWKKAKTHEEKQKGRAGEVADSTIEYHKAMVVFHEQQRKDLRSQRQ
jgi:hypothetical protein